MRYGIRRSHRRNGHHVAAHKFKFPTTFRGYKIRYVGENVLHDYAGMNYWAGKQMGFRRLPKRKVILLDDKLPKPTVEANLVHEWSESEDMRKGMDYWPAHERALKAEGILKRVRFSDLLKDDKIPI